MNPMTQLLGRCLFVCTLLLMLAGCKDSGTDVPQSTPTFTTPPPPEFFQCSIFDKTHWQKFRFGVDSPADVVSTVAMGRKGDRDQIWRYQSHNEGKEIVEWNEIGDERDIAYRALFRNEVGLFQISGYMRIEPTLGQIINCLGVPEYYEATYFADYELHLNLKLWYPEKGIVIEHFSFHNQELPPPIDADYRIPMFYVLAPGEPVEMVANLYVQGEDPDVQAYGLCVLRPWPGSIEALEVESFLDEQRCGTDTIEPANLGNWQHGVETTNVSYYSFGGLRIAVKRGSDLFHLHGDHLGSRSLTTDSAGAATASRAYHA